MNIHISEAGNLNIELKKVKMIVVSNLKSSFALKVFYHEGRTPVVHFHSTGSAKQEFSWLVRKNDTTLFSRGQI